MPRSALSVLSAAALTATVSVTPVLAAPTHTDAPSIDLQAQRSALPAAVDVERLAGQNRYATAAEIAGQWSGPVDRVYVVGGHTFPDAMIAAARAGAFDAPVLLTKADHIPNETVEELKRLSPAQITVIGGAESVSNQILDQLGQFAGSQGVQRTDGGNRYATSARVASQYAPDPERVFLASGQDYPDALSAAAIAAAHGEPLLLTRAGSLPAEVAAQLDRLNPQEVVVIGGPQAIADSVAAEAASYSSSGEPRRISGGNRYETSAAVAAEFAPGLAAGYVASGQGFSDALVISGLAGREGAPVVLTQPDNVPDGTTAALEHLTPESLFVAGGPAAVSQSVVEDLADPGAPDPEPEPEPEFPDEGSTGVPDGVELTPSDSLTITEDGTVIDGLHVTGTITVEADNVTIRNTLIQGGGGGYPIHVKRGADDVLIEQVELDNLNSTGIGILINGAGTTVRAADIHSAEDGIRIEADDVLIERSYMHDLHRQEGGHHDTIQIRSGDNVTIRGNNLQPYVESEDDPMNAAIQIGSLAGDDQISNLRVIGNLMNGGNFTINGGGRGEVDSARYAENEFGRDFRYGVVGNLQNSVWEDSNVWHDTGQPVQP